MLYISYQGIYDGQNYEDANTPKQINKALGKGFSCLINVSTSEQGDRQWSPMQTINLCGKSAIGIHLAEISSNSASSTVEELYLTIA